jgi:Bifunctional DNA primase/polymerase, N-terminal
MSAINVIAQAYIDAGWSVVPLVSGEQRANTKWQSKTYTADSFKADNGIAGKCGEPSGWRVDVDLDHPLAVEIAPMFLPDTKLIHGRTGKPDSHWWYICEGIKTHQFTGLKAPDGSKQMLVEIRSTGGYTALPPSGHPSGDTLVWTFEGAPLRVTPDELLAPVKYIAIATLIAIHWPGPGARHAMVGHLAGFLSRLVCYASDSWSGPAGADRARLGSRRAEHDQERTVARSARLRAEM